MDKSRPVIVIHASFRRDFALIKSIAQQFLDVGFEVLAPRMDGDISRVKDGFALFADETTLDPRLIELRYLQQLKQLGENGFSYFVNPDRELGRSASYELGIAQAWNVRCFFLRPLSDLPAFVGNGSVCSPEEIILKFQSSGKLPKATGRRDEKRLEKLWKELVVPSSVVATGAIIEHAEGSRRDILLVKTHKWQNRFSIVGGKVRRNERLIDALHREVSEETKLRGGIGQHLCTFDQLKSSGYYREDINHIFVDYVYRVASRHVRLNEEAEEFVWMPADIALRDLDIEPNAKKTIEIYLASSGILAVY